MITTVPAADPVGDLIGDSISEVMTSALDAAMKAIWTGATWLLNTAFSVADAFSTFTVDTQSGPVAAVWPTLLATSAAIALGLFFWQLSIAALRGGRGMMQVATGPVAYGIALAMTVTAVAGALAVADGLTTLILTQGLNVSNFSGAFTHTSLGGQALNEIKAVALGLIGFFGLVPAALGWVFEIIWRQAAILVLVATVPITAAGLLAHTTASWFWRGLRWTLAAVAVKPVLALIVVIGVAALSGGTSSGAAPAPVGGQVSLLAGIAVLWVALTAPMALFRLLAFVDPATDAGATFREQWSQLRSRLGGGGGSGGSGFDTPSGFGGGLGSGSDSGSGGVGAMETANTARFDAASGGSGTADGSDQDMAPPPPSDSTTGGVAGGSSGGSASGGDMPSAAGSPSAPQPPDVGGSGPTGGGSRPAGGSDGGSGGGAAAGSVEAEAAEAAVIL